MVFLMFVKFPSVSMVTLLSVLDAFAFFHGFDRSDGANRFNGEPVPIAGGLFASISGIAF